MDVTNATVIYTCQKEIVKARLGNKIVEDTKRIALQLSPTPSINLFTLRVRSLDKQANISIIDVNGIIRFSSKTSGNQIVQFGQNFEPGTYMVKVRQGEEVKTLKAAKVR